MIWWWGCSGWVETKTMIQIVATLGSLSGPAGATRGNIGVWVWLCLWMCALPPPAHWKIGSLSGKHKHLDAEWLSSGPQCTGYTGFLLAVPLPECRHWNRKQWSHCGGRWRYSGSSLFVILSPLNNCRLCASVIKCPCAFMSTCMRA